MSSAMRFFATALAAAALAAPSVFTLPLEAQERRWTLPRVLERAAEQSPDVQRARAELGIAEAHHAYGQQPVVGNPVLAARAMVGVPDDRAAIYAFLVGLPFDFSGRQSLRSDEADALVEASSAALEAAQNDARAEAALAYVEVVAADGVREQREGRVRLAEDLVARTRTLFAAGTATQVDLSLIEAELGEARAALYGAEAEAAQRRATLRARLDLEADDPLVIEGLEAPASPAGQLAAWRERGLEQRAEPRAYAARRGSAALPAMEQAREAIVAQLQRGATDLFRVIGTQRQLVALRERRVEVLRDAWRARLELERAMGMAGDLSVAAGGDR
jgi:cobalt-zinc-cadmium efflux system outer membrane protein